MLGIALGISPVVENFDQPDPRRIELVGDSQRVVVARLFHLMTLEGRSNVDRNHQLALCARHLRQGKQGARAGPLATGADEDDDGKSAYEGLHLAPRLLESRLRDVWIVPGAEPSRRRRSNEQPFLLWHVEQREFIRIKEPRDDRPPEPVCVLRVTPLCCDQIAAKHRLYGAQNIPSAPTCTQEKNLHLTPSSSGGVGVVRNGMTTQLPRWYGSQHEND